jgi:hypothetical protein
VVRAGALEEAAAGLAGEPAFAVELLVAELLVAGELLAEEQAASVAPRDTAHRIPATDRVFRFIDGPSYLVGIDSGDGSRAGVTASVWLVP